MRYLSGSTPTETFTPAGGRRLLARLQRLRGYLARLNERRRQRSDLARLEDYLLDDIGLTREEVEREINRSLWD